ncbi:ATP-binding protein [Pedobacter metabolipauper]|uniref:histidine kinase n=1 Tax=Pedobacter metabolipauper TaxID=425513 RepID=A0A4R6SZT7_9SPHI|nr:HAMP domain-containing sensor histidine kinase [Pedobacter metabolipauper]TDQ10282.1 signal transduction histidine kinase [Pedobacter metabolipauper]
MNYWVKTLFLVILFFSCGKINLQKDHQAFFGTVIERAEYLKMLQNPGKAIQYLDSTYAQYPDAGPADRCKRYLFKATLYREQRNFKDATTNADSALFILLPYAEQTGYILKYAEATLLRGDILFDQGLYSYAYQYYYLAKKKAEYEGKSPENYLFQSRFNNRLAVINYKQDNFKQAVYYYKNTIQSLHLSKKSFDTFYEMQGALSNIAFSYTKLGLPDSTLKYYTQCIRLLNGGEKDYSDRHDFITMAKGVVFGNMGDAYFIKENFLLADSFYRKGIRINSQKGYYNQDALISQLKLAHLHVARGQLKEAGLIFDELSSSKELVEPASLRRFYQNRAAYNKAIKNFEAAYSDLQRYIRLEEQEALNKRKLIGSNVGDVFKLLQQEYDINSLTKQDQQKNIVLFLFFLFLMMAIVIIFLTIRNSNTAKRYTVKIKEHSLDQQVTLLALEQSNREHSRMASILAHDLKNPIHAINSIALLMLYDDDRTDDDKEMLGLIKESAINLTAMIDDVLLVRNADGAVIISKEEMDMNDLLKQSVNLLRFKAGEKDQTILLNDKGPVMVLADREQIWRVINNLLVNAIKFSLKQTRITVNLDVYQNYIEVSVADQGIGIPDDIKNMIFEPFTEAQRMGTAGEETFGLGLYISRRIIEAHQGKIWFEHGEVKGTVFKLQLPL